MTIHQSYDSSASENCSQFITGLKNINTQLLLIMTNGATKQFQIHFHKHDSSLDASY